MGYESHIRLACFAGVFAAVAFAEWWWPRRAQRTSKPQRWLWNGGLAAVDTACLQALGPWILAGLAIGAAALTEERGWGLFRLIALPAWAAVPVSVLLLDAAIYAQHMLFHKVALLWRLHAVHHTDLDLDLTSALRFHPFEIVISMGIKIGLVLILGCPPLAVLIFEVLLNGAAMFNHANLRIPLRADGLLRLVIVTPDMHRVHHSVWQAETDSNYGFGLSIWDRLFGTYRAQPRDGHDGMTFGLEAYRDAERLHLGRLLLLPLLPKSKG